MNDIKSETALAFQASVSGYREGSDERRHFKYGWRAAMKYVESRLALPAGPQLRHCACAGEGKCAPGCDDALPAGPVPELAIGVTVDHHHGATIAIHQPHGDGTTTVLYSDTHYFGDSSAVFKLASPAPAGAVPEGAAIRNAALEEAALICDARRTTAWAPGLAEAVRALKSPAVQCPHDDKPACDACMGIGACHANGELLEASPAVAQPVADEREAFEKEMRKQYGEEHFQRGSNDYGETFYNSTGLNGAWYGWQARAALCPPAEEGDKA